ncbi:MAG TPA: hypothetical protein VE825_04575 [Terriglobales bacterium]|jgi:hypothetical protein|nr:hypothetical protein [Terriglobales bacterium]
MLRAVCTRTQALVVLAVILCLAGTAAAQVNGAIFTTTSDGTTVNGNLYAAKTDVYLNGGPQNAKDPGLVPDGLYYFQVTDPSGAVLLSTDDITCRQVVVLGGRIVGVPAGAPPATCTTGFHALGTPDASNGQTPVQLAPFNDTPNSGGEYKAWLTPVADYSPDPSNPNCSSKKSNLEHGFCDSDSKTDNFKVKQPSAAYITVCKFNDQNASGTQDAGEPLLAHWPITATGVDAGNLTNQTVQTQTDDNGCVSFAVTAFPTGTQTVTLSEGTIGTDWSQTAPLSTASCTWQSGPGTGSSCAVSGSAITLVVSAGDTVAAPNFGNFNPNCTTGCTASGLVVSKDANPSFTRTFTWGITKAVDQTAANFPSGGSATFNYTVNVTHDSGTDSAWQVTGNIKVSNPTTDDITFTVGDVVDNGGACTLDGGSRTVAAGTHVLVPYTCTYTAQPNAGTNTATALWDSTSASGTAAVDFANAAIAKVDDCVNVTDTLGGTLGKVCSTDPSPTTFTYAQTYSGTAGTCTNHDNTATFTTNTSSTTGSDSKSVKVCVGADLTVSKTATATFASDITKKVDKTLVEQVGGTATLNYTVNVTTSGWKVSGSILVTNPNDWEAITADLSDVLSDAGGSCSVAGGTQVTVAASSSATLPYTCSFAAAPTAGSGTNTATATWDKAASFTPDGSATGTAGYQFSSLTVTDTFNGAASTLGTVTIPPGSATFTYAHTVNVPAYNCVNDPNTATIAETGQSASQTVEVCGPARTGALTLGFWQNKNGQGIIAGGASIGGVCVSGAWLRQLPPYQDLSATATCSQVASYVSGVIKAASASGTSMNPMLKAQMLATSLDVFFSDPALGGNLIGAPAPIGGVQIDLTMICRMIDGSGGGSCSGNYENTSAAFGANKLPVSQMIVIAASQSNAGGSLWYGNVKSMQQLAKDAFDAINNQVAFAP